MTSNLSEHVESESAIQRAVVTVAKKNTRERIVTELKKRGVQEVIVTSNLTKVITEILQNPLSMLVLDTTIGEEALKRILDQSRCLYKVDTRPIYLLCEKKSNSILGIFSEYNISRMRTGEAKGKEIKKDIALIYEHEEEIQAYRKDLHDIAYLREQGKLDTAGKILSSLHQKNPNNARISVEYAEILLESGNG